MMPMSGIMIRRAAKRERGARGVRCGDRSPLWAEEGLCGERSCGMLAPVRTSPDRAAAVPLCRLDRLDDLLGHFLGIAEQHHGVVTIKQWIVDAGIAGRERTLVEHDGAGLP